MIMCISVLCLGGVIGSKTQPSSSCSCTSSLIVIGRLDADFGRARVAGVTLPRVACRVRPPARLGTRSLPFLRPVKKQSRDPLGKRKYSRAILGGNTPFTRCKTFLFCKSFPPQPFLFLLQDSLHGFPRLFTFISEHICFMLFSLSVFTLYSCRFRAVD